MPKESSATNAKIYIVEVEAPEPTSLAACPYERALQRALQAVLHSRSEPSACCHTGPVPSSVPRRAYKMSEDHLASLGTRRRDHRFGVAWFQVQGKRKYDVLVKREHTFLFSFYQMRLV